MRHVWAFAVQNRQFVQQNGFFDFPQGVLWWAPFEIISSVYSLLKLVRMIKVGFAQSLRAGFFRFPSR